MTSSDLGVGDAHDLIVELSTKLDGLADEFDTMGDEHDALKWYVAEMAATLPQVMMTVHALALTISKIVEQTGVRLDAPPDLRPEEFTPQGRVARRQAQREAIDVAQARFRHDR